MSCIAKRCAQRQTHSETRKACFVTPGPRHLKPGRSTMKRLAQWQVEGTKYHLIRADDCKYCVTPTHILSSLCGRIDDVPFRPRHVSNSLMHFLMMSMALMKASLKNSNDSTIEAAKDCRVTSVLIWSAKASLLFQVLSISFNPATSWSQPLLQWGQASSNGPWRLPFKFEPICEPSCLCVHVWCLGVYLKPCPFHCSCFFESGVEKMPSPWHNTASCL